MEHDDPGFVLLSWVKRLEFQMKGRSGPRSFHRHIKGAVEIRV